MALDFGNLVVEDTEPATPKENPTIAWIEQSFNEGGAHKKVTVPASEAKALHGMLVRGATEADRGITIRVRVGHEEYAANPDFWAKLTGHAAEYQEKKGEELHVALVFSAKTRVRRPRTEKVVN